MLEPIVFDPVVHFWCTILPFLDRSDQRIKKRSKNILIVINFRIQILFCIHSNLRVLSYALATLAQRQSFPRLTEQRPATHCWRTKWSGAIKRRVKDGACAAEEAGLVCEPHDSLPVWQSISGWKKGWKRESPLTFKEVMRTDKHHENW